MGSIFMITGGICFAGSVIVCMKAQALLNRCSEILRWVIDERFRNFEWSFDNV